MLPSVMFTCFVMPSYFIYRCSNFFFVSCLWWLLLVVVAVVVLVVALPTPVPVTSPVRDDLVWPLFRYHYDEPVVGVV